MNVPEMKTIRVSTESGDKYQLYGPLNNDDLLEAILRKKLPDEWTEENDGPGFRASYIHIENEEEYQEI